MTIANLGKRIDTASPERPAFIIIGGDAPTATQTFADVDALADGAAAALAARGLDPGARVAILCGNHALAVPAFLAIARAGLVSCPLSWKQPVEILRAVLADAGAALVLHDEERASQAAALGLPAVSLAELVVPGPPFDAVSPMADTIACIMYTSGSTGMPKGVPITHAGYGWGISAHEYDRVRATGTRVLVAAPLHHMNGQGAALVNLYLGATTVLMRRFDPAGFARAIGEWNIDEVSGVPTMIALALDAAAAGAPLEGDRVSLIGLGSAPLGEALAERMRRAFPNAAIINGYGTTETGIAAFGAHPDGIARPVASLGYPLPGVETRLIGPASPDQGVLHLRTGMMATGYWNRPELSAERFRNGWYDTGDVMRRDEHGFLYFVERADDMFICSGHNIYPAAVEALIERCPGVRRAAVVPRDDDARGRVPVAFVVAAPDLGAETIRAFTLDHGPAHAHPRAIHLVESLPLGASNKIDRRALAIRAAGLPLEPSWKKIA